MRLATKQLSLLVTLAALFAAGASPSSALPVINGGFDTGNLSGWTATGQTGATPVSTYVHSGSHGAYFFSGTLSQTIATIAGASYDLSFWVKSLSGGPNSYSVVWDGNVIFSGNNAGGFGFTEFETTVLATSASTALTFGFSSGLSTWALDDVELVQIASVAVAEPATAGLLMPSLLALGLLAPFAGRRAQKA